MNLSDYLKSEGALSVSDLRAAAGVKSNAQVRQWQHGYADRLPSPAYCVAIEKATAGVVMRRDLRPDDWYRIWPELVTKQHPAPESAKV